MKKLISVVMVVIMAMSFAACSKTPKAEVSTSETTKSTTETTKAAKSVCANLIPHPNDVMSDKIEISMTSSIEDACFYRVENAEKSDFESYVKKCKDMGFTIIEVEGTITGGNTFCAYNEEKTYALQVLYSSTTGEITIACDKD